MVDAELAMNVLDVLVHRRQGDDQPVRDLAIGQPLCDEAQRLRLDDWELSPEVQAEMSRRWPLLSTETLGELADLPEYRSQFLRLFGFGIDGVDYSRDVDHRVAGALQV